MPSLSCLGSFITLPSLFLLHCFNTFEIIAFDIPSQTFLKDSEQEWTLPEVLIRWTLGGRQSSYPHCASVWMVTCNSSSQTPGSLNDFVVRTLFLQSNPV